MSPRHRYTGEHTTLHVAPPPNPPGLHTWGKVPRMTTWWRSVEHARSLLAIIALILGIVLMGAAIILGVGITAKIAQIGDQLSNPEPAVTAPATGPEFTGCGPDNTSPC